MAELRVGFIGFGEVASTFAKQMTKAGAEVWAYDVLLSQRDGLKTIRKRAGIEKIEIHSLEEVCRACRYLLSTVTTHKARDAAASAARYIKRNHVYIDLNSTSPAVKTDIGNIIRSAGAHFVEAAILGAIGTAGHRACILTSGEKGKEVSELLNQLGLNVSFYSTEIGKASMFKMLRSILSKGIECILLEFLVAGKRAGIGKDLWEDITRYFSETSFEKAASNWIQTHPAACERRHHEMLQVIETMREIGVDPIMTSATEGFFGRSLSLEIQTAFPGKPASPDNVVDFLGSAQRIPN